MGNFKKFMKNFGLSLLAYFAMSFLGALCLSLLNVTTRPNAVTAPPQSTPWWVEIILWLHVLVSVVLYFYFGTRLKLIGNHLLNFLSASGSMALGFFLIFIGIYFNLYLVLFGVFSFIKLSILLTDSLNNEYVAVSIVSTLPTIIIWFGMLYRGTRRRLA